MPARTTQSTRHAPLDILAGPTVGILLIHTRLPTDSVGKRVCKLSLNFQYFDFKRNIFADKKWACCSFLTRQSSLALCAPDNKLPIFSVGNIVCKCVRIGQVPDSTGRICSCKNKAGGLYCWLALRLSRKVLLSVTDVTRRGGLAPSDCSSDLKKGA